MAKHGDKGADGSEAAEPAAGGGSRRKMMLIAGGALLLVGAGGGGAFAFGALDGLFGSKEAQQETAQSSIGVAAATPEAAARESAPTFYALPEILVSLNTGERRSTFLKVKASVELQRAEDQARVERLLPRVVDYCQTYLRELRLEELRGSAGNTRLRQELLRRISTAVAPVQVNDVLFNEIIVQ